MSDPDGGGPSTLIGDESLDEEGAVGDAPAEDLNRLDTIKAAGTETELSV